MNLTTGANGRKGLRKLVDFDWRNRHTKPTAMVVRRGSIYPHKRLPVTTTQAKFVLD